MTTRDVWDDLPGEDEASPAEQPKNVWPGARRREGIDGPLRHTYVVLRAQFREQCAAAGTPCHICEQDIDYRLRHGDPWAWELDHLVPVAHDPSKALVPSLFRASHSVCNKRRGLLEGPNGDEYDSGIEPSEDW